MKAYLSNLPDDVCLWRPRFIKQNKYLYVQWLTKELVIYLGDWKEWTKGEIDLMVRNFKLVPLEAIEAWSREKLPGYEHKEIVCLPVIQFLECVGDGLITEDDGVGYYADFERQSNIRFDFKDCKAQLRMFLKSKKRLEWYPTHVVWYSKSI